MKDKTKKLIKILSIGATWLVSLVLVAVVVLSVSCSSVVKPEDEKETTSTVIKDNYTNSTFAPILFTFGETTVNEQTKSVSKTITATVLPEDAPDKSVDWAIHWSTNNEGEDAVLSDYISLTPLEDGSNVATITCYKGFEGSTFMIWVKTRVGGFAKNCIVRYEGAPESFEIGFNGERYGTATVFELGAGQSYDLELILDNALGFVGSRYSDFIIESISMQGRFIAEKKEYVNGPCVNTEEVVIDLSTGKAGGFDIPVSHFLDASIENNVLKINVFRSEMSFRYPDVDAVRSGTQYTYKAPYSSALTQGQPENCFVNILIKENVSGETIYLSIDLASSVSGVTLDSNEIVF